MKIWIKPLSVNKAYSTVRGRRIKSPAYRLFEKELLLKLPKMDIPEGK